MEIKVKVHYHYVGDWSFLEKVILESVGIKIRSIWVNCVANPHIEEANEEWDRLKGHKGVSEEEFDDYCEHFRAFMKDYDEEFRLMCRDNNIPFTMRHDSGEADGSGIFVPTDDPYGGKYAYITLEEVK